MKEGAGDSAGGYKPPITRLVTSRGCLLPHESALAHHAAYSVSRFTTLAAPLKTTSMTMLLNHSADIFSSCRLECGLARAESEVHCVPWALPRGPGVKVFFVPLLHWWSLIPF